MTEYSMELIANLKATALELYERAEELVGDSEGITDFKITIKFEQGFVPAICCTKEVISKKTIELETKWARRISEEVAKIQNRKP